MKVNVKEEPAWKRILEIEVESTVVDRELDKVVEEYRRRLVLPGFRKGKVPAELARKHLGEDLEGEVLRRIIPDALDGALKDSGLKPLGDPRISNLKFNPGQPLTFTAAVEVMPQVEITGYEGLKLTRQQPEIQDEDLNRTLDRLRDQHADLEEADRPAHGGDVVVVRYREIGPSGKTDPDQEPVEVSLEIGSSRTPEAFNRELMGTVVGDMKEIPLDYPPDYPDEKLAGTLRRFHVTVAKVQEKIWPALGDAFAKKVLGTEDATLEDLKSRIRLNHEAEARMHSMQELESKLVNRLLELNPFDLPQGVLDSTLDRIMERVRNENPNMPPDEESRVREQYRTAVERQYRVDILMEAVGRKEGIEVTEEDLDQELASYAEREGQPVEKVKARIKKEGDLERLRDDLFRRRVLDKLTEKADVTVTRTVPGEVEETA
jgi:trigger factor